uniref:Uncharacterized protein n=2 Tax=Anguilla anguilla TaxID=7936 RepID=A0A0E9UY53_ANGAN
MNANFNQKAVSGHGCSFTGSLKNNLQMACCTGNSAQIFLIILVCIRTGSLLSL